MLLEWHRPFLASVWEVCATTEHDWACLLGEERHVDKSQSSCLRQLSQAPAHTAYRHPDCLPNARRLGVVCYTATAMGYRPSHHHTCKPNMECLVFVFLPVS